MKKKIILPLMLSLIIVSATPSLAYAANTKDSVLPTKFIAHNTAVNTATRQKTNSTPVYINNKSGMSLWVYANRGLKPSNLLPGQLFSTGTTDNYRAVVKPGKYVVKNSIYVKAKKEAQTAWLNISTQKISVSGNCEGVWSPDTAGKYPSAN